MSGKNTCVLDSFAFVTGLSRDYLTNGLTKDGFERGFHTQEIIRGLVANGYFVTPIELYPMGRDLQGRLYPIRFPGGNEALFAKIVRHSTGVLTGLNERQQPHAVACEHGTIYDPADGSTKVFVNSVGRMVRDCPFTATCFWKVDKP